MNIDPEFVKTTTEFIDKTLEAYKAAGVSPSVGDIWNCQNVGDFLCGFFVGELVGSILSAFQYSQKRDPTGEEHLEIVGLVESRSTEIKEFFLKFNRNPEQNKYLSYKYFGLIWLITKKPGHI